jgi:hypothetical protein
MDEIKIKAVIDAADSAKTVAELKKALRDLKSAALQVEEGSDAFNRITQTAGELQDKIGDLNATTRALGDDLFKLRGFVEIGAGIAGAFSAVQGAAALFGSENEAVEKSLLKVQSAMAILNGLMAIGEILQKESTASLLAQNIVRSVTVGLVGKETVSKAQLAVANGTATITQRALNAAMTANPIGILIGAVTALIGVYAIFSSSTDDLKRKNDALNSSLEFSKELLENQADLAENEIKNRKKLAESKGASNKELNKLDIELLNEQEKNDKKRQKQLEKTLVEQRKMRTNYIMDGKDEEADALNEKIKKNQEELDAVDKNLRATVGYENKYALERQVIKNKEVTEAKKAAEQKAKENKKGLDKQKNDYKDFVFDIDALNDILYDNELNIQKTILDSWEQTYDIKLQKALLSQKEETDAIEKISSDFLTKQKEEFLKSKDWLTLKIDVKGNINDPRFTEQWTKYLKKNIEIDNKIKELNTQTEEAKLVIQTKYSNLRTKLLEEELKRQKEALTESARIVLSTEEYNRFFDFIKTRTDILIKNTGDNGKKALEEVSKGVSETIKKSQEDIKMIQETNIKNIKENIRKDLEAITELQKQIDDANAMQDRDTVIDLQAQVDILKQRISLKEDQIKADEKNIEYTKARIEQGEKLKSQVKSYSKDLENGIQVTDDFNKELEKFVNLTQVLGGGGISFIEADINGFSKAISRNIESMINFNGRVDEYTGTVQQMLNLSREVNDKEVGNARQTNLLSAAIYKDKFETIKDTESEINASLVDIIDKRVKLIEKGAKDENRVLTEKEKEQIEITKSLVGKSFAVEVKDPVKQFGLDKLSAILPEQTTKLVSSLQDRLKSLTDLENRYYEQSQYELFTSLEKGEITQEEYNKKREEMQLNHEENLLVIQVTYGEKGQNALADNAVKRKAYIDQQHKEEVEKKFEVVKKIVDLEKMAADLVLQVLTQRYQNEDRLSQKKYEDTLKRIDDEQRAYEDSISNRTAAEESALAIQEEFDLKRQEAEDKRNSEADAIAKKRFEAERANKAAQLLIEYGVAIAKTFATLGWPAGIPGAAFLAAQLALQESLVLSQEYVPAYATGGLVTGPGGPKEDKITAKLSNGESVINAKSTKMFAPILSAINVAGGGVPIPNMDGSMKNTFADGGIVDLSNRKNTPMIMGTSQPVVVGLDGQTMRELQQIMNEANKNVSVSENAITNSQEKVAKVERRTKF